MKAVIVVPYRGTEPVRRQNWATARSWWGQLGIPIYTGDSDEDRPFDVTQARNAAVRRAIEQEDWEVALMADADVVLGRHSQARAALSESLTTHRYVVAHSEVHYFGPSHELEEITGNTWETAFAFTRAMWDVMGGFDPRFRGFGHQVEAFFHAAKTLFGAGRILGRCDHLWHPYSADQPNPHLAENRALVERYWAASGDRVAMHDLLSEYAVRA